MRKSRPAKLRPGKGEVGCSREFPFLVTAFYPSVVASLRWKLLVKVGKARLFYGAFRSKAGFRLKKFSGRSLKECQTVGITG